MAFDGLAHLGQPWSRVFECSFCKFPNCYLRFDTRAHIRLAAWCNPHRPIYFLHHCARLRQQEVPPVRAQKLYYRGPGTPTYKHRRGPNQRCFKTGAVVDNSATQNVSAKHRLSPLQTLTLLTFGSIQLYNIDALPLFISPQPPPYDGTLSPVASLFDLDSRATCCNWVHFHVVRQILFRFQCAIPPWYVLANKTWVFAPTCTLLLAVSGH